MHATEPVAAATTTAVEGSPPDDPFGRRARTAGAKTLLAAGFVGVLLVAGAAAFFLGRRATAPAAAGSHAHGTGPVGDAAKPVVLDPEGARRIGVTFAVAKLEDLAKDVRTVAQVTYDETRVKVITPKIDGWVERLYVNYTGQPVAKGDPLFSVYAPMVVTAQEELLVAKRLAQEAARPTRSPAPEPCSRPHDGGSSTGTSQPGTSSASSVPARSRRRSRSAHR